jgi:hypothetical protein
MGGPANGGLSHIRIQGPTDDAESCSDRSEIRARP